MILDIFVPRPSGMAEKVVAPGSAIVAATGGERPVCHYEGGINGQADIRDFAAKLLHAAGRLTTGYPTSAKAAFLPNDLILVGKYDSTRHVVTEVLDEVWLERWSGEAVTEILGHRLPNGPIGWREAASLSQPPSARVLGRAVGRTGQLWCRMQSGQVVRFDVAKQQAEVFEHDDDGLPELMAGAGLSDAELRFALGDERVPAVQASAVRRGP